MDFFLKTCQDVEFADLVAMAEPSIAPCDEENPKSPTEEDEEVQPPLKQQRWHWEGMDDSWEQWDPWDAQSVPGDSQPSQPRQQPQPSQPSQPSTQPSTLPPWYRPELHEPTPKAKTKISQPRSAAVDKQPPPPPPPSASGLLMTAAAPTQEASVDEQPAKSQRKPWRKRGGANRDFYKMYYSKD